MRPILLRPASKIAQVSLLAVCLFVAFVPRVAMAATATPVQLTVGSIPSDRILVLQLKLTSISVKPVNGAPINILANPATVEFAEMGDVSEPLGQVSLPPGKYNQVVVTTSGCDVSYIGGDAVQPTKREFVRSFTSYVSLQPALQVGTAPLVINLRLDTASTLPVNQSGKPNFNKPVFRVTVSNASTVAQAGSNGRFIGVIGTVTSTLGSNFSMVDTKTGAKLTFSTNANTQFINATLSTLPGLIVEVSGTIGETDR